MSTPLWHIQLQVQQGSFTLDIDCQSDARVLGLFGPSGSGKTTCLESIAGLRAQTRGTLRCREQVWLDSKTACCLKPEQRGIGYVPQQHLLFPHLTAEQNLRFGQTDSTSSQKLFNDIVDVLELRHLLDHRIHQLSGGQAQRIALGRALCSDPRMLMLDEPLASLDAALRQRILPFLVKVREHFKIPILIVSHSAFELQALCDEVITVKDGQVTGQGTPNEIFTKAEHYHSATSDGFENILQGKVIDHTKHGSLVQIAPGCSISVLGNRGKLNDTLMVGIPANDILIAKNPVKGISARNRLPARIENINTVGNSVALTTRLHEASNTALVVELTIDAIEDLSIAVGDSLHLYIKSSAIKFYG